MNSIVENLSTAAGLLQKNQHGESVQLLATTIRRVLDSQILSSSCSNSPATSADACRIYTVETPPIEGELWIPPDSSCLFYQKAFCVQVEEDAGVMELASTYANQLTAIFLYNIGLGYHREGILRGSTKCLQKACTMYRPALAVLRQCSAGERERLLMMATTNNLAHIHSNFLDTTQFTECQELMAELLHDSWTNSALLDQEIKEFFSNSFLYGSSVARVAPAA